MKASLLHSAFEGRRIFVTGHTGFKGGWLCEWLLGLGAEVAGYSLAPDATPALFERLGLETRMHHRIADVRDPILLAKAIGEFSPECIFHLAAQPIVRASYAAPVETFAINIMGTVHLLDALRGRSESCAMVIVTTDKCYENLENDHPFRETDRLGGHDPYSASKAAAELLVESYRRSFFADPSKIAVASARAGNVIGGGDWSADRIVPDAVRALSEGREISVRNPRSTRPWQHVLEPLSGYLLLAARLLCRQEDELCSAFNFGPGAESTRTVRQLVEEILTHWPGSWRDASDPSAPHEARLLRLSVEKAARLLEWRPVWSFEECVRATVEWYRAADAPAITRKQIAAYTRKAGELDLPWASPNGRR